MKKMKGIDLVRCDWCVQPKDIGCFFLDLILSHEEKETVVMDIEGMAKEVLSGELPIKKYAKLQPHIHVAK